MKRITAALLAASALGCQLEGAPDPASGLGPTTQVVAPVIDAKAGVLFVDEDGTWAYRTDESGRLDKYEPGQVVAFGNVDDANRHLFAVLERNGWGLRLQRLDSEPVENRNSGSLIPLHGFDHETGRRWGFCAGSGSPEEAACLREAPPGTRWRFYPMSDARLVVEEIPQSSRKRAPVLPVEWIGFAAVSTLGTDVVGDVRGDWLAVPTAPMPRPTQPRIAVDPACGESITSGDDHGARWLVAEIASPRHPIAVTSEAYRLGVDALVDCDDGNARISVPGLYRRRLTIPGQNYSVPPLLAARPIQVRRQDADTARLVARVGAAVASGDWNSADFWTERLARTTSSRAVDKVLVDTMVAVAGGGRPEAAAYTGRYATRLEWNPKTSPGWLFGMSAVEEALGNKKGAIVRAGKIRDAIERSGADLYNGWFAYFWAREELTNRTSVGESLEALEPHPKFRTLASAGIARRSGAAGLDALRDEFEEAGASDLHDALTGRNVPLECEDECGPDSYGRIWASGAVEPRALSRVRRIDLRPGYRLGDADGDPIATAERLLALYPLLDPSEQPEALDRMVKASLAWTEATCDPAVETPRAEPPEALRGLRVLGIDAALRMNDWQSHPLDATMAWLAIRGIPAACASTAALIARSRELAANVGSASVPARFLDLHLEKATDDELPVVLASAARFATEFERGDRCVNWNVALAAGLARAQRFDDAHPWIEATARCDVIKRVTIDTVAAYLNFERTGKISRDFGREVRARLAHVVHVAVDDDTCAAQGTLDYDLLPALTGPIREMVERLELKPEKAKGELQVVTASDQVSTARENLADAARHADEKKWIEAARSLGFARDRFEALGHQVGLARVAWLEAFLFDGKSKRLLDDKDPADPDDLLPRPLTKAKEGLGVLAKDPEQSTEIRLAHALLTSDQSALEQLPIEKLDERETLCTAPSPRPEGSIVLDRQGGVLKAPAKGLPTPEDDAETSPENPPTDEGKSNADGD